MSVTHPLGISTQVDPADCSFRLWFSLYQTERAGPKGPEIWHWESHHERASQPHVRDSRTWVDGDDRDNTRIFRLHVRAGDTSAMFTQLPSRTLFIDADRYVSDDSGRTAATIE
jgi:hypothetical protein